MKRPTFWLATAALALFAGGVIALASLRATWPLGRLPLWDGAGNGWGAVELWAALSEGRLVDFLVRLNAQDKWPFGFSILMLPFVALGGATLESATLLPALAFALVPALLVWLAREVEGTENGERGLTAALIASALWLTSPLALALVTVVMRETTGAALAVALTASYLRARRLGTLASWRLAGLVALALLFTKYNYFLLNGVPLLLHALLELGKDEKRALGRRLSHAILRRGWRSPARWIALVAALSLASILVGQNPGGLIYGVLVVATLLCLSLQWKQFRLWPERLAALDPAPRALFETFLLPLWIWSLSPSPIHPKSVIAFLRNRPGDLQPLSGESLLAPLRSFVVELVAIDPAGVVGVVGGVVLALALGGALWAVRRRGPRRALALAALIGLALVTAHPMKEARFLITVAPFLFLAAAFALTDLLGALRPPWVARSVLVLAASGAALIAGVVPLRSKAVERLLIDHRQLTGDPAFAAPLDEIVGRLRGRSSVAFLGATNELSEALVRWRAFGRDGKEMLFPPAPRGIDGATPFAERDRRFDAWLERERPSRLVTLEPLPESRWWSDRDFRRYNAWQAESLTRIDQGGRWRLVKPVRFPALGLKVSTRTVREP